jgi:hypothetical protein
MAKIKLSAATPTSATPTSIGAILGVQQAEYYVELPVTKDTAPKTVFHHYDVVNPKLVWRVTHNQNTRRFIATLRDYDGNQFSAMVRVIDSNSFEVVLSSAMKGSIDVYFDVSHNFAYTIE